MGVHKQSVFCVVEWKMEMKINHPENMPENWERDLMTPFGEVVSLSLERPSVLKPRTGQDMTLMIISGLVREIDELRRTVNALTMLQDASQSLKPPSNIILP